MSLALYRKYRPSIFADVIGQEHVTVPLSNALESGRIHHAYLFSGPRGCGKTSSARIMARSLNCEKGPTPNHGWQHLIQLHLMTLDRSQLNLYMIGIGHMDLVLGPFRS